MTELDEARKLYLDKHVWAKAGTLLYSPDGNRLVINNLEKFKIVNIEGETGGGDDLKFTLKSKDGKIGLWHGTVYKDEDPSHDRWRWMEVVL